MLINPVLVHDFSNIRLKWRQCNSIRMIGNKLSGAEESYHQWNKRGESHHDWNKEKQSDDPKVMEKRIKNKLRNRRMRANFTDEERKFDNAHKAQLARERRAKKRKTSS